MLYNLVYSRKENQFADLCFVAHMCYMRDYFLKNPEFTYLSARVCIALLRYTKLIFADKAFYLAGLTAKAAGMKSMAFICWNRFLDLCEAIEDGTDNVENVDFAGTDVPYDGILSKDPWNV
jgi:intraflagellar transport protein 172